MTNTYDIRGFWNKGEDGKLGYGAINPDAKLYLQTMKDWMSKGYMDKEAGIKDPSKSSDLVASGKAGIMFGPDGLVGRGEKTLVSGFTVFNKDFKDIDAWFAYFNKMFAKQLEQEGIRTSIRVGMTVTMKDTIM